MNEQIEKKPFWIFIGILAICTSVISGIIIMGLYTKANLSKSTSSRKELQIFGTLSQADYSFIDQHQKTIKLSDLTGKIWIANFIFTRCGSICPVMSMRMSELQKSLGHIENVRFVSFSVDPEYDRPEVLLAYAKHYGADLNRWMFLTGNKADIYALARQNFRLGVEEDETTDPSNAFLHSSHFVLIDPKGQIRGYYDSTSVESRKTIIEDIDTLLLKNP